jgi:RecB family exonuclease
VAASPPKDKNRVSLSHIDTLLECPFAYWCKAAAKLAPAPEPGDIIGRMTLGNVMHEAWRQIADMTGSGEITHRTALLAEWDSLISSLSRRYPLLSDSRSGPVLSDLKNRMAAVADILDDMWERAAAAGMSRRWTKTELTLPEISSGDAAYSGRADRVDFWVWPGGEGAVIFDYKLGGDRDYAKQYQLASYGAALRESGVPVAGFCYLCHADAKKPGSWSPEVKDIFAKGSRGRACGEHIDDALERLEEISRLISEGKYEARYDSRLCGYCDYTTICRRGERFGDYEKPGDGEEGPGDDD